MDEKHKRLSIIGFAILLVTLLGGTYAFFNYTKTGTANNIRTGRIYFNTNHGTSLNLTNIFPMTSTEAGNANLDSVTVGIVGDTTYTDGEEFEITLVDVTNTVSGKKVPMNYIASYTAATGGSIGASSDTYWTSREAKDENIYTLNTSGEVVEGKQVLVGYIKNGATGISGTLTIKAYIDADRIAISDTYYGNAPSPSPTASPITGPTDEYGTTSEWVDGRTVFTTTEWNSMATTPISFKIKAESQEGIWVEEPANGTIESCPNCKFLYVLNTPMYTTWNTESETPTEITSGYSENYNDIVTSSGKNYFLGVVTNAYNQITNAYACGIYNGITPFCIEGTSDGSKYNSNTALVNGSSLWNNTCTVESGYTECEPSDDNTISAITISYGFTGVGVSTRNNYCFAASSGTVNCIE